MILIKNARVISPLNSLNDTLDILIDDEGKIRSIAANLSVDNIATTINGEGCIVYPGFVDNHVHLRDPGQTYKEDIVTGSNAAIAGGYTHIVAMANTLPIIDNVDLYLDNQERMNALPLNVYQAAAISKGFKSEDLTDMEALLKAGVRMFTDDGIPLKNPDLVKQAMIFSNLHQVPLSFHEEDPKYIVKAGINEGAISKQLGFIGASREAEIEMVKRDLAIQREVGGITNVQHISAKQTVELVRKAKAEGLQVHAEACPHHFTLNETAVLTHGSLAKMNPPLREEADRLAIIQGLKDGTIDIIATDHAPHSTEEKSRELTSCPSGILGLETAYALANEVLVQGGYLDDVTLIERMAVNPGALIGIRAALDINEVANLVIVDPNKKWSVEGFHSKSSNSPFLHREMTGKVIMTIAKGKIVYQN